MFQCTLSITQVNTICIWRSPTLTNEPMLSHSATIYQTIPLYWAVVVAQLVERLLPLQEVRGLNPVIGKLSII